MRVLLGILSFAAVLALAGCGKEQAATPEPVPVKVEVVATQEVRPTWRYSGEIRPDTEVQMAFKQPGYVAALHQVRGTDRRVRDIQVGDEIAAGTVLAQLRRNDYEAALNTAVGQEQSTEGALEASRAQLIQAKADQAKADQDFERAQALYAAKAMTRPDYDAAVEQHDSAAAGVQAAMRQIEARQGQLSAAQGQKTSAQIGLGDTNLIAPMPGVIVQKNVERGNLVSAGTLAFTLDDTRVVKVSFGVPDSIVGRFKMGGPVPVDVEGVGRTFVGRTTEIAASANRDSRVFNIQVSIPNHDRSLRVGMIASVRIDQGTPQTVPVVPMTALITAESGTNNYSVFTIQERDGKQFAQLKSVRLGEAIGKSVVINEGLLPGERIIVNRTNQLNDGNQVRIVD
jgi:multidrug efflux pump subunit AcrA (membrane-fusion protein)